MHTAEQTYHQARRFYDAYHVLTNFLTENSANNPVHMHMHIPRTALLAFTCELYLKSVIHFQTGNHEPGHEIETLFGKIRDPLRTTFRVTLENIDGIVKSNFHEELRKVSDAFTKWRYFNEEMPTGYHNTTILDALSKLSDVFLGTQEPDWVLRYNSIVSTAA